jgi:hypothetical protein
MCRGLSLGNKAWLNYCLWSGGLNSLGDEAGSHFFVIERGYIGSKGLWSKKKLNADPPPINGVQTK